MNDEEFMKKQEEHYDRMNMCAFQCFEVNNYGRELMDSLKTDILDYKQGKRRDCTNIDYETGREDMLRFLLTMVDLHKAKQEL